MLTKYFLPSRRAAAARLAVLALVAGACRDHPKSAGPVAPTSAAAVSTADAGALSDSVTRIAFVGDSLGWRAVFTMTPSGYDVVRLTDYGSFMQPAWSADGRQIAYVRPKPPSNSADHIAVMDADGKGDHIVGPGFDPAWSPDGKRIAFWRYTADWMRSDIYVMDANGSNVVQITSNAGYNLHPTWSSKGTRIAYQSNRLGRYEVFMMDSDGTDNYAVTSCTAAGYDCVNPAFSPVFGDERIAFYAGSPARELRTIKSNRSESRKVFGPLPDQSVKPTWSPNAAWIAFDTDMGNVGGIHIRRVASTGGSSAYRVTRGSMFQRSPAWQR